MAMQALASTRATQKSTHAQLLSCRLEKTHKGIPRSPIAFIKAPTSSRETRNGIPIAGLSVWRASAGRLDWIALASMCLAGCLASF